MRIPAVREAARAIIRKLRGADHAAEEFPGSAAYWEARYSSGGNSGAGSYQQFAEFKAEVLNGIVAARGAQSVIEFGCGDGNQLTLAQYPSYIGFDVSPTAIAQCRGRFSADPGKSFRLLDEYAGETADLTLSLDVIYHLVEDSVFERHMSRLFDASRRLVVIYASDTDDNRGQVGAHVRHRKFSHWVAANARSWMLVDRIPNRYPYHGDHQQGSFAEFFLYELRFVM